MQAYTTTPPQENTIPTWLLPCTCDTQRCHCNAKGAGVLLFLISFYVMFCINLLH